MKIKICGLKYTENINEILGLNPDYIGFIFHKNSPRYVGDNFICDIDTGKTDKVGVYVNHEKDFIVNTSSKIGAKHVQLHGSETPELCQSLKNEGLIVIKAFQIDNNFDFNKLTQYKDSVNYFLFDTKTKNYGGSGKKFDWTLLKNYNGEIPFILSGGIGPNDALALIENKEIKKLKIHAIDINSKFENAAALKDINALNHFISTIKNGIFS